MWAPARRYNQREDMIVVGGKINDKVGCVVKSRRPNTAIKDFDLPIEEINEDFNDATVEEFVLSTLRLHSRQSKIAKVKEEKVEKPKFYYNLSGHTMTKNPKKKDCPVYSANDFNKQVPLKKDYVLPQHLVERFWKTNHRYQMRCAKNKKERRHLMSIKIRKGSDESIVNYFVENMLDMIDCRFFYDQEPGHVVENRLHNAFVLNFVSIKRQQGCFKNTITPFLKHFTEFCDLLLHKEVFKNQEFMKVYFYSSLHSNTTRKLTSVAEGQVGDPVEKSGEDNDSDSGSNDLGEMMRNLFSPSVVKKDFGAKSAAEILTSNPTMDDLADNLTELVNKRISSEMGTKREEMVSFAADFFSDTCKKISSNIWDDICSSFTALGKFFVEMFEQIKQWFMTQFVPGWEDFWAGRYEWQIQIVLAFSLLGKKILDLGNKLCFVLFKGASMSIFDCDLDMSDLDWNNVHGTASKTWTETADDLEKEIRDERYNDPNAWRESMAEGQIDLEFEAKDASALVNIVSSFSMVCFPDMGKKYGTYINSMLRACPDFVSLGVKCYHLIMYEITSDVKYLGESHQLEAAGKLIERAQVFTGDVNKQRKILSDPDYISLISQLDMDMKKFEIESLPKMTNPKLRNTCILFSRYAISIAKLAADCVDIKLLTQQRRTPGYILFTGPAGQGKSAMTQHLCKGLYYMEKRLGNTKCTAPFNTLSTYTPANGDDYAEGWFNQSIMTDPEVFSTRDEAENIKTLSDILRRVSTENCPMNMAFGDKGKCWFNADWIISSTNCPLKSFTNKGLEDPSAYFRRILLPVEVRRIGTCVNPEELLDVSKVDKYWIFCIPRKPAPAFRSLNEAIERAKANGVKFTSIHPTTKKRSHEAYFLSYPDLLKLCYWYVRHQKSSQTLENSIFSFSEHQYSEMLDDCLGPDFADLKNRSYVDPVVFEKKTDFSEGLEKLMNETNESTIPPPHTTLEELEERKQAVLCRVGHKDATYRYQSKSKKKEKPHGKGKEKVTESEGQCKLCPEDEVQCTAWDEYRRLTSGRQLSELIDGYWASWYELLVTSISEGLLPQSQYRPWMALACRWRHMELTEKHKFEERNKWFFEALSNIVARDVLKATRRDWFGDIGMIAHKKIGCQYGQLYKSLFHRYDDPAYAHLLGRVKDFEEKLFQTTWTGTGNGFTEFSDGFMPLMWVEGYKLTHNEIFIMVLIVAALLVIFICLGFAIDALISYFTPAQKEDETGENATSAELDKMDNDKVIELLGYEKACEYFASVRAGTSKGQTWEPIKAKMAKRKAHEKNNKHLKTAKRVAKLNQGRSVTKAKGHQNIIEAEALFNESEGQGLKRCGMASAVAVGRNMRYLMLYMGNTHMGGSRIAALGDGRYTTASHVLKSVNWTRFTITSFYDDTNHVGKKFYSREDVIVRELDQSRDGVILQFSKSVNIQTGEKHLDKMLYADNRALVADLPYLDVFRVCLVKEKHGHVFFFDELHQAKFVDNSSPLTVVIKSPLGDTHTSSGERCFRNEQKGYLRIMNGGGQPGDCGDLWMGQHSKTGKIQVLGAHFAKDKAGNACCYPLYASDMPPPEATGQTEVAAHLEGLIDYDKPDFSFVRGYDQIGTCKYYPAKGGTEYIPSPFAEKCIKDSIPFPYKVESCPAIRRDVVDSDGVFHSAFTKTDKGICNGPRPEFPAFVREAIRQKQWHVIDDGYWDGCNFNGCRFLTIEEVIFGCKYFDGLNTSSAVGAFKWAFPTLRQRSDIWNKDKKWIHPVLRDAVSKVLRQCQEGKVPLFIVFRALKDELLALEKVAAFKVRAFSACDIVQNIILAMVYGMPSYYLKKSMDAPCIGKFNPHSCDVDMMARKFPGTSGKMGLDGSFWDGSVNNGWAYIMAESYNNQFYGYKESTSEYNVLICITKSVCNSLFVRGNKLYSPTAGHISGSQITTDINNFINYCQYQLIWRAIYPGEPFRKNVTILVGGDDVRLENRNVKEFPLFNMATCAHFLAEWFGVVCTNPDKTPITQEFFEEDPDFLSRDIVVSDGLTVARLKKESIIGMLAWVRDGVDNAMQMNLDAASMEMVMYGKEDFDYFYSSCSSINRKMGNPYKIYDYHYWRTKLEQKYWKIDEPSPLECIYGTQIDIINNYK